MKRLLGLSVLLLLAALISSCGTSSAKTQSTPSTSSSKTSAVSALQATSSTLAGGTVGSGYSATLQASGGTAPYTFSLASGSLPAGLTLSSGGTISGKPTASCASSFSVTVTDSESTPQTVTFTISLNIVAASTTSSSTSPSTPTSTSTPKPTPTPTPAPTPTPTPTPTPILTSNPTPTPTPTSVQALQLTTATLANGTVGTAYSAALAASGGTSPYKWSVASGSLPAGLTLSTSGTISGTPSASGTSSFSITVKDSESSPQAATSSLSLTIAAAATSASTSSATSASNYTSIVNGQPWPLNFDPFCSGAGQCPWNNPLPDSPTLMANSASMISGVFGSGGGMTGLADASIQGGSSSDFAHPVYLASSTDPLVTIASGCGTGSGSTGTQIHIPAQARPTTSSDHHMGVIQPNGIEYDFWNTTQNGSFSYGTWTSSSTVGCQYSGNSSNIVTGTGSLPSSATSGAALSAGNLRVNELENGSVPHALFVVIQSSNGYVFPGTSAAGGGGTIPIGARVQLKYTDAQIDAMTGLAAWEKTLLHQLHDYGLYILDTGGDGYLTYKWESPTQYTSFGGTNPGTAWQNSNKPPSTWTPSGINWATDLQIVDACYAEGSC